MKKSLRARRNTVAPALKKTWVAAVAAALIGGSIVLPASPATAATLPYQDTSLSFSERAADLVSRMTLAEKAQQFRAQTSREGADAGAPAIDRLGVERYFYWNEALHGVARAGEATSFTTGLGIASSWNPDLVEKMSTATSDEARAYWNDGKPVGLTYWSPTINMGRDPRWGRAEETYGEDPYLTSKIGGAFVDGLQGDDEKYNKVVATAKHFAGNNSEINRHTGSSEMTERELREYYTPAFASLVEDNDVRSVMSSYNAVNGVPMPVNSYMLTTLLRDTWGFDGFVTSDCGGIWDIYNGHKWKPEALGGRVVNETEATAYAIKAGNELDCRGSSFSGHAPRAVGEGLLTEADVDVALTRVFTERFALGEFDASTPWSGSEYSYANQVSAADHIATAATLATEAPVLLKNDAATGDSAPLLPLTAADAANVVVVGDLADEVIMGDYSPSSTKTRTSPIDGIRAAAKSVAPSATVTYIDGIADSVGPDSPSVQQIEFLDAAGTVYKTVPAAQLTNLSGYTPGANGAVTAAGTNTASFAVNGVDTSRAASIRVTAAGASDKTSTGEFLVTYGTGQGTPLVGRVTTHPTASATTFAPFTGEYNGDGGYTGSNQTLVFTFSPSTDATLSAADEEAIRNANAVITYVGTETEDAKEGLDRTNTDLPRGQADLIEQVVGLNERTAVYIQAVGEVDIEPFKDDVPSIFWTTYNGQTQGAAAGDLLFGKANPSGKLPFTYYSDVDQLPEITDYSVAPENGGNGRTYQYTNADITYPFGHGLSYSTFDYSNLRLDRSTATPSDTVKVTVDVTNTSSRDGSEVVQLYATAPGADGSTRPKQQLKGFDKVAVPAGQTKAVTLELDVADLWFWDEAAKKKVVPSGSFTLSAGTSSATDGRLSATLGVTGEIAKSIKTVSARPDGAVLNTRTPDNRIHTTLSVAAADDSFLDVAALKREGKVTFTTANAAVAKVDGSGNVSAVGNGVTSVTAKVTAGGVTKESSFPVVVQTSATSPVNISVDGRALQVNGNTSYDVGVAPGSTAIPQVTATPARSGVTVAVTQATAIPGEAVVKVTENGTTTDYKVRLINQLQSIDFTSLSSPAELTDRGWSIYKNGNIGENPATWAIAKGKGLTITTEGGDVYQGTATQKNLFQHTAQGNWTATTKIAFDQAPTQKFQQGGVMVFDDADNYVKFNYQSSNGGGSATLQAGTEAAGSFRPSATKDISGLTQLWLRVAKTGGDYAFQYSTDGSAFTNLGSASLALANPKFGLVATNSNGGVAPLKVTYESIDVVNYTNEGADDFGFADRTVQLSEAKAGLQLELVGASTSGSFSYVIAPMDLNTAGATVTSSGRLTATKNGVVEVTAVGRLGSAVKSHTAIITITDVPPLQVSAEASARCIAGKAVLTVKVTNNSAAPVNVDMVSAYGTKSVASVAPGKNASHAFTTRLTTLPAGSVAVTATAATGADPTSRQLSAAYPALTC